MSTISLKLDMRTATGKQTSRLREQGMIPSVVYGGSSDPLSTQSVLAETMKVVRAAGKHSPVTLMLDGKKKLAIIKSIDIDPVKHSLRHIAFHTIKQNELIETEVSIRLDGEGESVAERAGLVVLQAIEHVAIKAKPADLPEFLSIDIRNLASDDDRLTLGDIVLPEGVQFAEVDQDLDLVVANVYEPSALQAANEAAGGDAEAEDAENVASDNGETVTGTGELASES